MNTSAHSEDCAATTTKRCFVLCCLAVWSLQVPFVVALAFFQLPWVPATVRKLIAEAN